MSWFDFDPTYGLWGLAIYSFLSATVIPGSSEVALFALLRQDVSLILPAVLVSTAGNTLGGMFSWWCGRTLPRWQKIEHLPYKDKLERWGSPALLLAWAPVIGDALCLAAGWLRMHWLPCAFFMGVGKFLRYGLIAQGTVLL